MVVCIGAEILRALDGLGQSSEVRLNAIAAVVDPEYLLIACQALWSLLSTSDESPRR
jgi:hypothetical protein